MIKICPRCAKKVQYEEIFSYNLMYYETMEQHNPIMALAVGKQFGKNLVSNSWPTKVLIIANKGLSSQSFGFSSSPIWMWAAAAAKLLQSCLTLCESIDGSPPGSPVPGILQARTLEWVSISFSNAWKWKVKAKSLSRVRLFRTPWTAAYQAPPSMGFSRQEYWRGVPLSSP